MRRVRKCESARISLEPLFEKLVDVEGAVTLDHLRGIRTEVRHTAVQEVQQQPPGCRYDICSASLGAEASGFGGFGDKPNQTTGKIIAKGAKTETKSNCKNNEQFYTLKIEFTVEVTGIPMPPASEHPDMFVPPRGGITDERMRRTLGTASATANLHIDIKKHNPSEVCIDVKYDDKELSAQALKALIERALEEAILREMERRFQGKGLNIDVQVDPKQIFSKDGKFKLIADYFGLGDLDPAHKRARRSDQAIKEIEIKLVDGAASVPPSSTPDPE